MNSNIDPLQVDFLQLNIQVQLSYLHVEDVVYVIYRRLFYKNLFSSDDYK